MWREPSRAALVHFRLVLTITTAVQEVPPDHRGGYELDCDDLLADAETHDEALERIQVQLRPGWRILSLRVDR